MHRTRSIYATGLALLAACTTAPVAPIPDPLPETLEWARPAPAAAGAFLGLEVRENDSGSLEELRFDPGVRVVAVADGSPAKRAGFAVGDVLLAWGEVRVDDPATLDALLAEASAEEQHELEVQRGDSVFSVPVRLRPRGAPEEAGEPRLLWRSDPARSRAGWLGGRGGVVLVTSDPDGPFPRAGVEVESVVLALDGEPVLSERGLIRALQRREPGERVEVLYRAPQAAEEPAAEPRSATVRLFVPPRRITEATLPVLVGYRSSVDGDTASFYLIDLWFISLFRYRREGSERHYSILRFITFATGVGELEEGG